MCRWIAYSGSPIFIGDLVTKPDHSLVEQSLNTTLNLNIEGNIWSTNGDGCGVGWYHEKEEPGLFKDKMPAWNNENLHEICAQTKAKIFFAHIRASTTGKVHRSNSHPFKYKNWLFQHNGDVHNFTSVKRDLHFDIAPELYTQIEGTTDSETCFYMALTYGLENNPKQALEKMINRLKEAQKKAGIEVSLNLSCSLSDGQKIYTIRYGCGVKDVKTQFYSTDMSCVKDLVEEGCKIIPKSGVIIVSEPLDHQSNKWIEVPENSFLEISDGKVMVSSLDCD